MYNTKEVPETDSFNQNNYVDHLYPFSGTDIQVCANLVPCLTDTYDFGSTSLFWKDVYAQRYFVDDLNFFINLFSGSSPAINFDGVGNRLRFDRVSKELAYTVNGMPNPDFIMGQGFARANNKMEIADVNTFISKSTSGPTNNDVTFQFNAADLIYFDDSSNELSVTLGTEQININPTYTSVVTGQLRVRTKDAPTTGGNIPIYSKVTGSENRPVIECTTARGFAGYISKNSSSEVYIGNGSTETTNDAWFIFSNTLGYEPFGIDWSRKNIIIKDDTDKVGAVSSHSSAILELSSNTKGFLMTQLTTTQRNAIAAPAFGLQVYNETKDSIEYFAGVGIWKSMPTVPSVLSVTTTQITSITTGVNIGSALYGEINTVSSTLAGLGSAQFTVTATLVTAGSYVFTNINNYSGTYGTNGFPQILVSNVVGGAFDIVVNNVHALNALAGVIKIKYMILQI